MSNSVKVESERDANQTLKFSFNDIDKSLTTTGFLTGLVGRKITQAISTTSAANDTATFTYSESGTTLFAVKVIYTDSTWATMISAERIS